MDKSVDNSQLLHISDQPWSNFTEADYTLAQWHNACLIHQHENGTPTSKAQCKLPVRTPSGVLNRNGVHAAAAALAGARGGVDATSDQKASAARQLVRFYQVLQEDPPPSIKGLAHSVIINDFLEHHGIKGMKWGVRKAKKAVGNTGRTKFQKQPGRLSDSELKRRIARMEMEKRYNDLNKRDVSSGEALATSIIKSIGTSAVTTIGTAAVVFLGKKAIEKKFGSHAVTQMFPKKK